MSEATTDWTPKITEAHQSLKKWMESPHPEFNMEKGYDIPIEHVAALVLFHHKWQNCEERRNERKANEDKKYEDEKAARAKRDEDRKQKELDRDAARAKKDEEAEQKRKDREADQEKKRQEREDKAAAAKKKREEDAEAKRLAKEAEKADTGADGDDSDSAPVEGGAKGRAAVKKKLVTATQEAVGQSAGSF